MPDGNRIGVAVTGLRRCQFISGSVWRGGGAGQVPRGLVAAVPKQAELAAS